MCCIWVVTQNLGDLSLAVCCKELIPLLDTWHKIDNPHQQSLYATSPGLIVLRIAARFGRWSQPCHAQLHKWPR